MKTLDSVSFVKPDEALLRRLLPVARRIFTDTFAVRYDPVEFENFCDGVYLEGGTMERDFSAPDVHWRVAVSDGDPIGYAKLTPLRAPAPGADPSAVELQQLYVLKSWHGTGVADRLMEWGLATARGQAATEVCLTVFDHNERAKRFYARFGFRDVGHCTFQLGDRIDEDRIWCLRLGGDPFDGGATAQLDRGPLGY